MISKLRNLDSIFNSVILRIPDYQRGYSWDEKQLNDLWNDLRNIHTDSYHFTGILTFEKACPSTRNRWEKEFAVAENYTVAICGKEFTPYFIVDGQQRLVSIIILISLLDSVLSTQGRLEEVKLKDKYISISNRHSPIYLFGYEKDTPSHQYLIGKIFDDPSMVVSEPETIYTLNLERTKSYFLEKLMQLNSEQKERLLIKVTKNLLFNMFEIESDKVDMSLVFETLNYRGKQLSKLELFKNRLIFLISKRHPFQVTELREKIIDTWQDIYEWLGKNPGSRLNDDDFLRAFWIMYFNHDNDTDDEFKKYEHDIFEEKFKITDIRTNDNLTRHSVERLLKTLSKAIKCWYFIHNPKHAGLFDCSDRSVYYLEKIIRNKYGSFLWPLIMAYLVKDQFGEELESVLKEIERHNFCVYFLAGKQADTNRPHFYRQTNKYFRHQTIVSHSTIISELKEKTVQHVTYENLYNHIHRNRANNLKYYDWNGIRYFMWDWEEHKRSQDLPRLLDFTKAKIGLIFPDADSGLRGDLSFNEVRKQRGRESLDKLGCSLGNITISPTGRAALRFPQLRTRLFEGSHSDRDIAKQYSTWSDKDILERGLEMLSFIEYNWSIRIGDDNVKRRLLLDGVQI